MPCMCPEEGHTMSTQSERPRERELDFATALDNLGVDLSTSTRTVIGALEISQSNNAKTM